VTIPCLFHGKNKVSGQGEIRTTEFRVEFPWEQEHIAGRVSIRADPIRSKCRVRLWRWRSWTFFFVFKERKTFMDWISYMWMEINGTSTKFWKFVKTVMSICWSPTSESDQFCKCCTH